MNLRNQILAEHTKTNCQKIVSWVGDDIKKFNELFELFLQSEYRITQRAAWPMSHCAIAHPEFMQNNFDKLVQNLKKPGIHNSIKRNSLRLLQEVDIPDKYDGDIMEICFQFVEAPEGAVAIKAFSLTILGKLAKKYPEIIPEIKLLIEDQLPYQTAGFKGRAKKLLMEFKSLGK
ncbi:MAG: hypothetical protein ABJA32_07945 [Ginsengibacter sp.]|jgi:hypothetical protein